MPVIRSSRRDPLRQAVELRVFQRRKVLQQARALAAAAMLAGAWPCASALTYDYCARGTGPELQKTLRVTLDLDGADPGADAPRIAVQLIRRLLWDGKAKRVAVEPFDETGCAAALGRVEWIKVTLTQEKLEELRAEAATRGAIESGRAAATLAAAAQVRVDRPGAVAAPDGAYYTLRVYYATDRGDKGEALATASDPGARFGGERGKTLSFGSVEVSVPRDHRAGQLETPSILKLEFVPDPAHHIALRTLQPLSIDDWRREMSARSSAYGQPGVLLFIHGYNVSFSNAALRTGQLAYDLAFPGVTMFYSWPSQGSLIGYNADQQTVEWSIPNLQQVLGEIASLAGGAPVYVIAHSMGNRVFTRAFERLLTAEPARRRAFSEIVLTAPDIDADVFRTQIAPRIVGVGPRVTLYASDNDSALGAARRLSAGYRRLGEAGKEIVVLPGMDTVDATKVKTDLLGHSYFGDSNTVLSDLFHLIRDRLKPAERGVLKEVDSNIGLYWQFP